MPAPVTLRPAENLHLACKVTGFSISASSSSYAWHWIRQPFGSSLQWMTAINPGSGGKWYNASLKSRTTVSSDSSKNEISLQLNSVTAADSAVYFCSRETTVRQGQVERRTRKEGTVGGCKFLSSNFKLEVICVHNWWLYIHAHAKGQ